MKEVNGGDSSSAAWGTKKCLNRFVGTMFPAA
jgi:hypothetical protein